MQHTNLISGQTPDGEHSQHGNGEEHGQGGIDVDCLDHEAKVSQMFHFALSWVGRNEASDGADNTFAHPAGVSCPHDAPRVFSYPLAVSRTLLGATS